jgi:hypothetical protein
MKPRSECPTCGVRYMDFNSGISNRLAHRMLADDPRNADRPARPFSQAEMLAVKRRYKISKWNDHVTACGIKHSTMKKIYTHDNCADGLGVYMLAKTFAPWVTVEFVQYGTQKHRDLIPEPGVVFADFSPHPDTVDEWKKVSPVVLDHHIHAKDLVAQFEYGEFDNDACGTAMFFRWLKPAVVDKCVHRFVKLTDLTDRYVVSDPDFKHAQKLQAVVGKFGYDVVKSMSINELLKAARKFGGDIIEGNKRSAAEILPTMRKVQTPAGVCLVGIAPLHLSSRLMEIADSDVNFVAVASIKYDSVSGFKSTFSTRSKWLDVGSICKSAGGGGHKLAAGFTASLGTDSDSQIKDPVRVLLDVVDAWCLTREQNIVR